VAGGFPPDDQGVVPRVVRDEFGISTETLFSRLTQCVVIAYLLVGSYYLYWRTFHTVNTDALFLSIPLLVADYLGFGFFALFAFNLWARVKRYSPPPPPGLSVDVFIPTYNEPREVLKPTILSALAMDYPHETYVLDDGRREEVRLMCEDLGAHYLTRPDNRGAKAGNINAALPRTHGELIAIFDADHAPFRQFLTELLGYFNDPSVGLVQAPQAYYNLDSFQHARGGKARKPWHEQSVFYDMIMPGKDRMNAAFWCGSSAIVRRAALEEVGGVNTLTVTEDMHTSMGIHANGWKSIYHDRELAVGIAPDDLEPFLVQRLRWAQGAMEILRKDNPLKRRGLTLRQRISYFTSSAYVLEYLPKAVYLLMPPIALISGILPMTNMGWNLLYRFAPYYFLGLFATQRLTGGSNPMFRAERFHLLKMEIMLRALTSLVWPRKLKFVVTPKSASGDDHRLHVLRHVRFQLAAGIICAAAAIWGAVSWALGAPWALSGVSLLITIGWAGVNAGMVGLLVRSILRRHHRRGVYRFEVAVPLRVKRGRRWLETTTADVSTAGVGFDSDTWFEAGQKVDLVFSPESASPIAARGHISSCRRAGDHFRVGAEFERLSADDERRLVLMLFQGVAPAKVHPDEGEVERRRVAA